PASLLSNIGTWAQRIAQDWLVMELTNNNAVILGLVTALQFLPSLLLSLWGGLLADRFDKRKLLFLTNLGGGLGSALMGILVVTGLVQIWHVFVLAFVVGVFSAVDAPIRISFNSELVGRDDLPNAVSLNSANFNLGRLIGPASSGLLIAAFGTGPSFLINSLTYLAMIVALWRIRVIELHRNVKPNRSASLREAFKYVLGKRNIAIVMLTVFFATTFGLNYQIFMAVMATTVFDKGPREFGVLGSVLAIGSFTGAVLAARLEHLRRPSVIALGAVGFGLSLTSIAFAPSFEMFALGLPLGGCIALLTLVSANSYVQTSTDPALRGRVMGIYLLIFMGGTPLGSPLIGWVADQIGIRNAIFACGLIVALGALFCIWLLRGGRSDAQGTAEPPTDTSAVNVVGR
ncbi:MAG: MFS transporter, partial [Microbacteriaceae bacterium]|nr:MFS transporter [Microbacteriaceae bacterium]